MFDIAFATVVLRIVFGWLFQYRRLFRLLVVMAALLGLGLLVVWLRLPMSSVLAFVLIPPLAVLAFLAFLPEINRIYQSASRGGIFGGRRQSRPEMIPQLCAALTELARRRIGALLVFPRNDPVSAFMSGGEELDAKFNHALLLSLLNPHCPRHDGAVVIQGDRLTRVGAVLPLASADGQEGSLGTRHLAAMGLTERCDADVLVVSEERGTVSHSRNGKIGVLPTAERAELEGVLETILGSESVKKYDRKLGTLSIILWVLAALTGLGGTLVVGNVQERLMERPEFLASVLASVTVQDVPANLYVESLSDPTVRLYLKGSKEQIFEAPLVVVLSLKGLEAGKLKLNLQTEMVSGLPRDVRIERFEPESVEISLAQARQLDLRVGPPSVTNLSADLQLGQISYAPSKIVAVVKDSRFPKNGVLATRPIDLSGVTAPGTITRATTLDVPGSIQGLDASGLPKIEVTLEILEKKQTP